MQTERLRALGEMASGIAHDINNAISPVSLYTELLLQQETQITEAGRGRLVTMRRAIEDVAGTIERMREFYRPREIRARIHASWTFTRHHRPGAGAHASRAGARCRSSAAS